MKIPPKLILLIVLNMVGVVAYLAMSSRTWIESGLKGETVATGGDAIVWATTALPIAAAFFVADLIILVVTCVGSVRRKNLKFNSFVFTIPGLWLAGYIIDRAHH